MQCLILIRGLPGSGKSTMAKAFTGFTHLEADMFHMVNGEYKFDASKIKDAHAWCQHQCEVALRHGENVVVSNTFTQYWEMKFYRELAITLNIPCHTMTCEGWFDSVHNVPQEVIASMRDRWEY